MDNLERMMVGMARELVAARFIDLDPGKTYYHGTSSEKAAKGILARGIEPPDLTTRPDSSLRPVRGRVYMTDSLEYAIAYVLGGMLAGTDVPESFMKEGRYGYLFEIKGKDLAGEVHPDEDSVGEMAYKGKPAWLRGMAETHLGDVEWDEDEGEDQWYYEGKSVYDIMMGGEYAAWAAGGKILLEEMSSSQELELISRGAHVAYEGTVRPSRCWKFDKGNSKSLKKNGSNFFRLAERCR